MLLSFKDPFSGLYPIEIIFCFRFEIAIKLRCLNLEVINVIPWMPSSSNTSILIIKVFVRGWVGNIDGDNIKLPVTVASTLKRNGSFNPIKFHCEFSHVLLKLDNGFISLHLMGLLKRNSLRVRRFFFSGVYWKWSRVEKSKCFEKGWHMPWWRGAQTVMGEVQSW